MGMDMEQVVFWSTFSPEGAVQASFTWAGAHLQPPIHPHPEVTVIGEDASFQETSPIFQETFLLFFDLWTIQDSTQGLHLSLNSGVTPDGVWGTIHYAGDQKGAGQVRGKHLHLSSPQIQAPSLNSSIIYVWVIM